MTVDHAAEADRVKAGWERFLATAPAGYVRMRERHRVPAGTREYTALLDPNRFTPSDADAIDALLPGNLGVELDDPKHYEPGYYMCCDGPCRKGEG